MNIDEINTVYQEIAVLHKTHLESLGINMPKLISKKNNKYVIDSLTLVYLYKHRDRTVTKKELTNFIRQFYPEINDVQQARHLSTQKGWNIVKSGELKNCFYKADDFTKPCTHWINGRRDDTIEDWDGLKKSYGHRCACCGSKENEPHFKFPSDITRLEKGHMDPTKSLSIDNTIPQCYHCNRVYRNKFIFDERGFIKKQIND